MLPTVQSSFTCKESLLLPTLDPYEIIAHHIGKLHGFDISERPAPQLARQFIDGLLSKAE